MRNAILSLLFLLLFLLLLLLPCCTAPQTPSNRETESRTNGQESYVFEDLIINAGEHMTISLPEELQNAQLTFVPSASGIVTIDASQNIVYALICGTVRVEIYRNGAESIGSFTVQVVLPYEAGQTSGSTSTFDTPTALPPTTATTVIADTTTDPAPVSPSTSITTNTPALPTEPTVSPVPTVDPTPTVTPVTTPTPEEQIAIESFEIVGPTDVFVNNRYYVLVKTEPENANEPLEYSCNMPDYCTIGTNGVFTPLQSGSVRITVQTKDKRISKSITIYIHNYVTDISLSYPEIMYVGRTYEINCSILPLDNQNKGVYWVLERGSQGQYADVVKISADGLTCTVTCLNPGIGAITVGSNDYPESIVKTIYFTVKE